ncbi:MAG: cobalamin B12-binding domain-containing protein, partial [Parcubacteria group bacterium]|nr:cobalamin B12-binding domain-containing protein [Parcubacteria group bacterium]
MRILLSAAYSIIEPLGLLYLLGLAKKLGIKGRIVLVKDFDFAPFFECVREFKPDLVGFNVYTGAHTQVYPVIHRLNSQGIITVIGGPHATYFAEDAAQHASYVVRGEGFSSFRRILEGTASRGILFEPNLLKDGFPYPDRETFYREHPLHRDNPIKNSISAIGCPYKCTYCYNSEYNRLYGGFRLESRSPADVVQELEEVRRRWPTQMIYFQDDVFGFNIPWLEEFVPLYRSRVAIPWHAQIRLELTRNPKRLQLFKEGGCFGITTAIEAADPWIRAHVLDRDGMTNEEIQEGCRKIKEAGLLLRTEQILAVPTGDLGTDLTTLRLNVAIRPDMAWSSIFAPYRGTALGEL